MNTVIFNGRAEAKDREEVLRQSVEKQGVKLRLGSLVFREDEAGRLYAKLKAQAAVRVGIEFDESQVSIDDPVEEIERQISIMSARNDLQGVMVQKPQKAQFRGNFGNWWGKLTNQIDPLKDVDCLTQVNLQKIYTGKWRILPATVKAVLSVWDIALPNRADRPVVIVGRSDLVGRPLAAVLSQQGAKVTLCGSKTANLAEVVHSAEVVISATGVPSLIKGEFIHKGAVVIDVGSPRGDVDFAGAVLKARFITPVPGGVGPMTVVSLLENLVDTFEK